MPEPAGSGRPPPRPYRNFLTPLQHRQFITVSLTAYALCYVISLAFTKSTLLGVVWPFRFRVLYATNVLFTCSLCVSVIRIWALQTGKTTTPSLFSSIKRASLTPNLAFVGTILYTCSALLYTHLAVTASSESSKLSIIEPGSHAVRPYINERALLYRSEFVVLALIQAAFHYVNNEDDIIIPLDKKYNATFPEKLKARFGNAYRSILIQSSAKSVMAMVLGWLAYYGLYRDMLWSFGFFKYTYEYPLYAVPQKSGVSSGLSLQLLFLFHSFLLSLLWDASNHLFSLFIVEQPLKKGFPITNESKDPNGTLISGLRSIRPLFRTIAFWELYLISSQFDQRRATLYQELDRAKSSTWVQILTLGTSQLTSIQDRIKATKVSKPVPKPSNQTSTEPAVAPPPTAIDNPTKKEDVISPPKKPTKLVRRAADKAAALAKSYGSSSKSSPPMGYDVGAAQKLLSNETKNNLSWKTVHSHAETSIDWLLMWPVAAPFRQTFSRRIEGIVCGMPASRASITVDAVRSLSQLAVRSLTEDQLGQVQNNVGQLARTFADTLVAIEELIASTPPHWTDVYFVEWVDRVPQGDVAEVVKALKEGLEEILRAFGEYFGAMGVDDKEIKAWKALVADEKKDKTRPRTPSPR